MHLCVCPAPAAGTADGEECRGKGRMNWKGRNWFLTKPCLSHVSSYNTWALLQLCLAPTAWQETLPFWKGDVKLSSACSRTRWSLGFEGVDHINLKCFWFRWEYWNLSLMTHLGMREAWPLWTIVKNSTESPVWRRCILFGAFSWEAFPSQTLLAFFSFLHPSASFPSLHWLCQERFAYLVYGEQK